MTKVTINPGVCGLITVVESEALEDDEVKVVVKSGCASVTKMMAELGDTFDSFEECLVKPGEGSFYEYASKNFPGHTSCPILAGIIKCMEVECRLALPKDATIVFE